MSGKPKRQQPSTLTPQIIETTGQKQLVVLTLDQYEKLRDAADATHHVNAMNALAAGYGETLTAREALDLADATTPLAFWRKRRGLTQTALAERAGISQSYVAGLEAGDRKGDPSLLKALARTLAVRMEDLVTD